jgi:hypothetical protein
MTLITELAEPQNVITRLDTQWEIGVIAKPTFEEGFIGEITTDGNTVVVGWDQIAFTEADLSNSKDRLENFFEVAIFSDHKTDATAKTNLIKILSQVRKHINRAITSGKWHFDVAIPAKHGHEQIFICSIRQILYYVDE